MPKVVYNTYTNLSIKFLYFQVGGVDKACLFNNFFFSVFNNESSTINLDSIPLLSQTLSSINFSESDVYNALTSLQSNKATGIDGIGPN